MQSNEIAASTNPFGALLREWRAHRRFSQLALAMAADLSQRHVSFLESGRARPSTVSVARLADALAIPLRERNVLLRAAGFADRYVEEPLDEQANPAFAEAVEVMLAHQDPYPAMVLDGRWNLVRANASAKRFFARFVDLEAALEAIGSPRSFQIARLCLHEAGLRPYIGNWTTLVDALLRRARRAAVDNSRDREPARFIDEIVADPQAPAAWRAPERSVQPEPALTLDLEKDGESWRVFTIFAHFGNPQSVALDELAIELFFPADDATRRQFHGLARTR